MWSEEIALVEGSKIYITTNFDNVSVATTGDRQACLEFQVVKVGHSNNAGISKANEQAGGPSNGKSIAESIDTLSPFGTQEFPNTIGAQGHSQVLSLESLSSSPKPNSTFPLPSTFSCFPTTDLIATENTKSLGDAGSTASTVSSPHKNPNLTPRTISTDAIAQSNICLSKAIANKQATSSEIMRRGNECRPLCPKLPNELIQVADKRFRPVVYFCPIGQDLPKARIRALSKNVERLGARVVQDFTEATHIIVSEFITSWEKIANRLGMKQEEELKSYLISPVHTHGTMIKNNIKVVKPKWVASISAAKKLRKPTRAEHWSFVIGSSNAKVSWVYMECSFVESCHLTCGTKKRKAGGTPSSQKKAKKPYAVNQRISQVFKRLAEIYQSSPIEKEDVWRSYQFRINAGRVMQLDFEISESTLEKLKKDVVGFGDGCLEIISQYLESGEVERLKDLETDKPRVAMGKMMDIWGVGSKKSVLAQALELIHENCSSIDDVRRKATDGTISLERNQLVGVECYEDILSQMSRDEAFEIGKIVERHTLEIYGEAEVTIMGSFRRGKDTCGDVDVHITCKSFEKIIPADALGTIVDRLWRKGHVCFHLTFLCGMETGSELADYQRAARVLPPEAWGRSKALSIEKKRRVGKSASSYMGVFRSPLKSGVRRRVDIKFYPYRERVFAALYFTGNGYFNRSMRLWARNLGFQLNDHGLFERGTKDRVMEATEERHVFDKLGLVYKEPQERDSFDALEPKNDSKADFEPSMSELKDYNNNTWVG
eukprot:scaffold1697_cov120-Cylindrotheca_fusiformis.AAC.18